MTSRRILANGIGAYCAMRRKNITVKELSETFKVTPERIAQAIDYDYFMFLSNHGPLTEQTIEFKGE